MVQVVAGWKRSVKTILLGGAAVSVGAFPLIAHAQESGAGVPDDAGAAQQADAGNAIIVTALKRE